MADQLHKARKNFLKKVSKPTIQQVLDGLLEDGVLSSIERDYITEKGNTTYGWAQELIDIVRKKGDEASMRMIFQIKDNDETLYSDLGLSYSEPGEKKQTDPSSPTTLTVEQFWEKKKDDPDCYSVSKTNYEHRVALMITNIEFTNKDLSREGAETDEENMSKVLQNLGYKVEKHRNLTAKDIEKVIQKFSKHPELKETDSVFVVIMSHGIRDKVLGINAEINGGDEFAIDQIYKHLGPQRCPALINKPKIIIIQACRGAEKGDVLVSDREKQPDSLPPPIVKDDLVNDCLKQEHKEKDFISLLSCTPDTVAWRSKEKGSLLIQHIDKVFQSATPELHIYDLFTKVNREFEKASESSVKQMATIDRCTFTKYFYPFPKLLGKT